MAILHIPIDELPASSRALLDHVRASGEISIDGEGESFRLVRRTGRTAAEALALLGGAAEDELDGVWNADMGEVLAHRKVDPDAWA